MHVINHLFKEVQENEHTAAVYENIKLITTTYDELFKINILFKTKQLFWITNGPQYEIMIPETYSKKSCKYLMLMLFEEAFSAQRFEQCCQSQFFITNHRLEKCNQNTAW